MHSLLNTLFDANLRMFANNFKSTAHDVFYDTQNQSLIHPGEFGGLRESMVREFLAQFLPEAFGVSQGFVVSPSGFVSKQCDVIIYSRQSTPVIRTPEHQRFFPVESVVGVLEVKSVLDGTLLRSALANLAEIKTARDQLKLVSLAYQRPSQGRYSPQTFPRDQLGTFILAERISCSKKLVADAIRDKDLHGHPSFQINMLCSIDDYSTAYRDSHKMAWMHPLEPEGAILPVLFNIPKEGTVGHLKVFFRYLLMIIEETTIAYPELTAYFQGMRETTTEDEQQT